LKNYDSILKNDGDLQKSNAPPPTKNSFWFIKTMSTSKPNKLPQEWNLYLISFPRYSDESFKM